MDNNLMEFFNYYDITLRKKSKYSHLFNGFYSDYRDILSTMEFKDKSEKKAFSKEYLDKNYHKCITLFENVVLSFPDNISEFVENGFYFTDLYYLLYCGIGVNINRYNPSPQVSEKMKSIMDSLNVVLNKKVLENKDFPYWTNKELREQADSFDLHEILRYSSNIKVQYNRIFERD